MVINRPTANAFVKGFSILELSIVLVVIGLLITGVIAGQHMKNALSRAQLIDDISLIRESTEIFNTTYGGIPGDLFNARDLLKQTNLENGNGNGLLEGNSPGSPYNEKLLFWQHLAAAGFIKGNYDGSTIGAGGMYASPFENIYYEPGTHETAPYTLFIHVSKIVNGIPHYGAFSTKVALDYDTKYDNGDPTSGIILAQDGTGLNANSCIDDKNRYNMLTTSDGVCQLMFYLE